VTAHRAASGHEGVLRSRADLRSAEVTIDSWFGATADRGRMMCTVAAAPRADSTATGVTRLAPADLHPSAEPERLVHLALREGFAGLGILVWADQVVADTSTEFHHGIETALTDLCAEHPVTVLCVYDRPGVGADHLDMAVGHHGEGLHEQQLALSTTDDTIRLGGEIDMTNLDVVDAALQAAVEARPRRLRVDLTGTAFVSAGAAQVLHRYATALRAGGADVELDGVAPHVARVLRLVGLHDRSTG
jgi:anti-anti-sigma factor